MAETRRPNDNRKPQQKQQAQRRAEDPLTELFFGESTIERPIHAPATVHSLQHSPNLIPKENRGLYGIPAEQIEATGDRIKLKTRRDAEPIKYGEATPGSLDTKESLPERPLSVVDQGKTRHIHGRVAIETKPVLIIDNMAFGFRGAGGRLVEDSKPLQNMPQESFATNVAEEFFLIGRHKGSGERFMLVPDTGNERVNIELARTAKARLESAIQAELEDITNGKGDASMVDILAERARSLTTLRKIRPVAVLDPGKEFNEYAQTVDTIIEGGKTDTQRIKGLVNFDEESRTFTITRPVRLDLSEYDVDIMDATGRNRQTAAIEGVHQSQPPDINLIMRGLQGEQLVQKEQKGEVHLDPPVQPSMARDQYAIFPAFN